MKEFIKKNWSLILALLYLIIPIDILPLNPIDDLIVIASERVLNALISHLKTRRTKKDD